MQDNKCGEKLALALKGKHIDILINNAGYFYEPVEKIDSLNFEEVTFCPQRAFFHFLSCVLICVYVIQCIILLPLIFITLFLTLLTLDIYN